MKSDFVHFCHSMTSRKNVNCKRVSSLQGYEPIRLLLVYATLELYLQTKHLAPHFPKPITDNFNSQIKRT